MEEDKKVGVLAEVEEGIRENREGWKQLNYINVWNCSTIRETDAKITDIQ